MAETNEQIIEQLQKLPKDSPERRRLAGVVLKRNQPLALLWVMRYGRVDARHYHFDQFFSAAQEAMLRAIERFNPKRGTKFSTYVATAMWRAIANERIRFAKKSMLLDSELGGCLPNDKVVYDESEDDYEFNRVEYVKKLIAECLSEREQSIIKMRYWDYETLAATGKAHGVTRERIRQIQILAIQKMRDCLVA